jgi:hypothetical protein
VYWTQNLINVASEYIRVEWVKGMIIGDEMERAGK